mmetsp:Transcript_284/g.829  ORF Transcript_284/g.829 Transcript_284/m.829 type:complete len:307 (-) Transcript_284:2251-3171(-)
MLAGFPSGLDHTHAAGSVRSEVELADMAMDTQSTPPYTLDPEPTSTTAPRAMCMSLFSQNKVKRSRRSRSTFLSVSTPATRKNSAVSPVGTLTRVYVMKPVASWTGTSIVGGKCQEGRTSFREATGTVTAFVTLLAFRGRAMEGMTSKAFVTLPDDTSTPELMVTTLRPVVSCVGGVHFLPSLPGSILVMTMLLFALNARWHPRMYTPELQLKIWGHCSGPSKPTCCHDLPPSSEAYSSLSLVRGSTLPQDSCFSKSTSRRPEGSSKMEGVARKWSGSSMCSTKLRSASVFLRLGTFTTPRSPFTC